MPTLQPGIYKVRYKVSGIFEELTVKKGDIVQAVNQAVMEFPKVSRVTEKGVKADTSWTSASPIFSIYIRVKQPLNLDAWNRKFLSIIRSVFPWYYTFFQRLTFEFVDYQQVKKEQAEEESGEESWISSFAGQFFSGGVSSYLFWLAIGTVSVYAIFSGVDFSDE